MEASSPNTVAVRKWLCFLCVALGTFVDYSDSGMINIALPTMSRSFGVDLSVIELIVTSNLLVITVFVITFGRVADMYGRKRLYIAGFATFTLATALCGLSTTIWLLVVFRCLQGIGAALLIANGVAILTETFPAAERGKALGILGSVTAFTIIMGPLLGGFLTDHFGWWAIFYVNVPVGIVGLLMALKVLPSQATQEQQERFDLGGAVTFMASLSCFLVLMNLLSEPGWGVASLIALSVATIVLGAAFFVIETRIEHPLIDLSLFRQRSFSMPSVSAFLVLWALFMVSFLLPFYLDRVLHLSPMETGYVLSPTAILLVLVSPVGGYLADRFGTRLVCAVGALVNCVGLIGLSTLSLDTSPLGVVVRLTPIGIGSGFFMPANNSAIMGSVPNHRLGIASGLIGAIRNLSAMSGVAITSLVFTVVRSQVLERLQPLNLSVEATERQAFASSVRVMFLLATAICFCAVATSFIRGPEGVQQETGDLVLTAEEAVRPVPETINPET